MLTKTRLKPETKPDIELRIDKNHTLQKFELVLVIGKNEIIFARGDYEKEIEKKLAQFQIRSKVVWEEILLVGETE